MPLDDVTRARLYAALLEARESQGANMSMAELLEAAAMAIVNSAQARPRRRSGACVPR
jgi:hypothetical protein